MNRHFATYRQTCAGYEALVRLPRDGFLKPLTGKGGDAIIYNSPLAAQEAATRALEAYLDGDYRRAGERLSGAHCEAEKLFRKPRGTIKIGEAANG